MSSGEKLGLVIFIVATHGVFHNADNSLLILSVISQAAGLAMLFWGAKEEKG